MKRLFQVVPLLAVLLLVGQPVLDDLMCRMPTMASCPMGMSGMDAACPMMQQGNSLGCSHDCCSGRPQARLSAATHPVKPRSVVAFIEATDLLSDGVARQDGAVVGLAAVSASPPHYLMNRVFRI